MPGLPIMLDIKGRRCVVVGGGPVALRRTRTLLEAGGAVTVIAPEIDQSLTTLPIEIHRRTYQSGDLAGAWLVIVASNDAVANHAVARDAELEGILVNRADDPGAGHFTVPAIAHHDPITITVSSGGASASAAALIRDELSKALDPDWPRLLKVALPWRAILQTNFSDSTQPHPQRIPNLKELCSPKARDILKEQGEAALKVFYNNLAEGKESSTYHR